MASKVNEKKLRQSLPTLLTAPDLPMWDRAVERERNDYHQYKFKKNNPSLEQEKFLKIVNAFAEYKETQERFWKIGNGKKKK
jgi:hypothetical protein